MANKDTSADNSFKLHNDWRGQVMARIRILFQQADPSITEEVKYKTASNPNGVLVWYHTGMLSTGEIYQKHLRLALSKGPALKKHDPKGLINSYRAIILRQGDQLDETAFIDLVRTAVTLNQKSKSSSKP